MRHRNSGRKFDRDTSHRRAMLRNLTANLVLHERIETTEAKAKEVRRVAERLITKARRLGAVAYTASEKLTAGDRGKRLHAERLVMSYIPRFVTKTEKGGESKRVDIVEKVFCDLAKRFKDRAGMHCQRPALLVRVLDVGGQGLYVPIENNPDKLPLPVHHRTS